MSLDVHSASGVDWAGNASARPANAPGGATFVSRDTNEAAIAKGRNDWLGLAQAPASVNTIDDATTITTAQLINGILYQDASAASVTMATPTAAALIAAYPNWQIDEAKMIYHASNHATNTSTISGGTDVTLVGSGAVINTGGQYSIRRTTATAFEIVRIG